jgi:hypothetical protein
MGVRAVVKRVMAFLARPHGDVLSFEREVEAAGVAGRADGGMRTIPAAKIVGSVGRAAALRSDFFYKSGKVTGRFVRIGQAMERGVALPPIEVYRARPHRRRAGREAAVTEYYVVDGHHRVAMAKQLGQDYLDAHVVDYRLRPGPSQAPADGPRAPDSPGGEAPS